MGVRGDRQQYWIDGGEPAAAPRWQQGWSDDLPQTMATLWKPQVAEMQVQWSAALGCYVVVDIPYLSTVVELRHAPAPQGPWSAPQIVYHIPPPQNDTRHFFCYTAMQHDTASLPPTAPSQSPSALGSEAEVVFTYVCNGKTLGDVFAKGAWTSYTPQFVRLRLSKAAPLKADDADARTTMSAAQQQRDVDVPPIDDVSERERSALLTPTRSPCNLTGTWHGHPGGPHGRISATPIPVVQSTASSFVALGNKRGTVSGATVEWGGLTGTLSANTEHNASAPPCTRISWHNQKRTYWCREPWCELTPPAPSPPPPWVPPPPPPPPPPGVNLPSEQPSSLERSRCVWLRGLALLVVARCDLHHHGRSGRGAGLSELDAHPAARARAAGNNARKLLCGCACLLSVRVDPSD